MLAEPDQIGRVVIKETVDNALDSGADSVTLVGDARTVTVTDNGPGLDRETTRHHIGNVVVAAWRMIDAVTPAPRGAAVPARTAVR